MDQQVLNIVHTNYHNTAETLSNGSFEPIECSIGGRSIVGRLLMDHHGKLSGLEGVAIRAYRDHRGKLSTSRCFVVTGAADADATFAIAALSGYLPDGLGNLAKLIDRVDTDPISVDLSAEGEDGAKLLLFDQMASHVEDAPSFYAGVDRWRLLTSERPPAALLKATLAEEAARVETAKRARIISRTEHVVAVASDAWGFDVWYRQYAPIIVAFTPEGRITVGARSKDVAEKLLGEGGLKNAFPVLTPEGWGGREAIGGSPRGAMMTEDQAAFACRQIALLIGRASP
jgi:hypothetical protein